MFDMYVSLLKSHDWYYAMSDDHGVWRKGSDARMNLMNLQKTLDPDGSIWNKHCAKGCELQIRPKLNQKTVDSLTSRCDVESLNE